MSVDKNQAMINFLIQCPIVQENPLFFNFAEAKEDNNQIVTMSNDVALNKPYIDGSVLKRYKFTMITFKSVGYKPVVKMEGYIDENVDDMNKVQSLIDWIREQAELQNYPNFGADCSIEEMEVLTENPALNGVDRSVQPPIAKYSVGIRVDYIDYSKQIWN